MVVPLPFLGVNMANLTVAYFVRPGNEFAAFLITDKEKRKWTKLLNKNCAISNLWSAIRRLVEVLTKIKSL